MVGSLTMGAAGGLPRREALQQVRADSNVTYLIGRNGLIRLRYGGISPAEALISDIEGWIER